MRACDLAQTPARIGDIVCHTRAAGARFDSFDMLGVALSARGLFGAALPMHCEVVVAEDDAGLDAIGGNVLQSVTRRRLGFAPGTHLLDPSYRPGMCALGSEGCVDRHMSRQPWSLLLQWR
jgi:hypothetical protein